MYQKEKTDPDTFRKQQNVYDDGNIPEADLPLPDDNMDGADDVIPDEVPRKDGPGGEN
nr:hypothetical protein [uncultured Eisenbergiella sp.]